MRVPVVANGDVKSLLDMDQTGMAYFYYFNNMEVIIMSSCYCENGSVKPNC